LCISSASFTQPDIQMPRLTALSSLLLKGGGARAAGAGRVHLKSLLSRVPAASAQEKSRPELTKANRRGLISLRPIGDQPSLAPRLPRQLQMSCSARFAGDTSAGASPVIDVEEQADIGVAASESGGGVPISIKRIHDSVRIHPAGTYVVAAEIDSYPITVV